MRFAPLTQCESYGILCFLCCIHQNFGYSTNFCSVGTETELGDTEASLEGWLQTPSKQNIRRHGWKKLYVVVSSRKIIFFNSEMDKQNSDPTLILDLNKVSCRLKRKGSLCDYYLSRFST